MQIFDLLNKSYQHIVIAKKLLWFVLHLFSMVPPFKQLKYIAIKILYNLKSLQPQIQKLLETNLSVGFIYKMYK